MSLDETLSGLMGAESVSNLSKKSGASEKEVSSVLNQAVPALLKGAENKSNEAGGASALDGIFSMLQGGGISDMLSGEGSANGSGILDALLGGGKKSLISKISKSTGVNVSSVESIVSSIAPALMGSLGKDAADNKGLDIASLISGAASGKFDLGSAASLLLSDADGDGKPDGIGGLLSKLFGKH